MLLIAFFTENGIPKTGLTATIDVWEDDGTQVVTAQAMTEIAGGFYKYDFSGYDESKDYCIRADGSNVLAANDRYVFATNEVGQVTEDLTDIKAETDKIQPDIIASPGDYKADVSGLAPASEYDAALAAIIADLDNPNQYKADVSALALEATAQLIKTETDKIAAVKTEVDKIQPDIIGSPDDYKADVSNLDVAVSSRSSHNAAAIWAVGTRTLTSFGTLITDIWNHAARTLTSFGTLITNIWTNATRTLTAGTKDTEIDAIKLETDKIQPDIIGSPADYKADVSALALEASAQLIKTETDKIAAVKVQTDKIPKLLGLAFENYKLYDQAFDADENLTSAKIRIYPTAADLDADTNKIAEYLISATFSAGLCTLFKVKLI